MPNHVVGVSNSINKWLHEPCHRERGHPDNTGEHDIVTQFLVREKGILDDLHDIANEFSIFVFAACSVRAKAAGIPIKAIPLCT